MTGRIVVSGGTRLIIPGSVVAGPTRSYSAAVLADGPTAYWRCGDSDTQLTDIVGGHDATEAGAAMQYGQTNLITTPDADGAVAGNGVLADHWEYGEPKPLEVGFVFSVECWFRPATQNDALIQHASANPSDMSGWKLLYGFNANRFRWYIGTMGGSNGNTLGAAYIETPASYPPGSTYHVVATYDSTVGRKIYVNGTMVASDGKTGEVKYDAVSGQIPTGLIGNEYFSGSLQSATALDGIIDEIAFYQFVLSDPQIASHYAIGSG